jgi:uncharacterized protein
MSAHEKYERLIAGLTSFESCLVAFSGGLDSTLLLRAARDALGEKVRAVTVSTPYTPQWEVQEAVGIAADMGVLHKLLTMPLMEDIKRNPPDRCYRCKKQLFTVLKEDAKKSGIQVVLDGTNADDLQDYRPGIKALNELGIRSPLMAHGLTKEDIRCISREIGLANWNRGGTACLLSRMPYNHEITLHRLQMIEQAEQYLMEMGFKFVRVRSDGIAARIEVGREERKKFFDEEFLDAVSKTLKDMGYLYVAFELEGYRTGSMNRSITVKKN